MKAILLSLLCFLAARVLFAETPVGPAYDLFLFHGKSQMDYEGGSGSKNHGRTPPYTYLGSVTSWALQNGATVTFRGNEARVISESDGAPCEAWDQSGSTVDPSRWLYSRTATTDIGIAFPNMHDTTLSKRWSVNCKQKIDADQSYGDDTHAAAGIIAVSRDLTNYNRDTFSSNMINEQDRIGVLPIGLDWMVRELAVQAANNLYPGAIDSGKIIVTPVVWNRFWADPSVAQTNAQYLAGQKANGVDPVDENDPPPVHGQNLSLEVTVPLNKHLAPGADPGAWIEPIGAVYVGMDCLNARLYLGQNAYIRIYADEMDSNFTLQDAVHITQRDTVKVDDQGNETLYVYTGPYKWLNAQMASSGEGSPAVAPKNHVAKITKNGSSVSVELFPAQVAYDPEQSGLAYLLGGTPPPPLSTLTLTHSGSDVNMTYTGPEHNGTAVYSEIQDGWRVRHTVGPDYDVALETTEQTTGNVVRVTRTLLDPQNAPLETSIHDYQNFKLQDGYTHTIPYEWNGSVSEDVTHEFDPVDDWRLVRIQEGSGTDERITTFVYETAAGPSFGKLKEINGADGETESFTYDSSGRLDTHTQILTDTSGGEVKEFDYTGGGSIWITVVPRKVTTKLNGVEVGEVRTELQVGETTTSVAQTIGSGFEYTSITSFQDGFEISHEAANGLVSTQELTFVNDLLEITTAAGAKTAGGTSIEVQRGSEVFATYNRPFLHILEKKVTWKGVDGDVLIDEYLDSQNTGYTFDGRKRLLKAESTGVSEKIEINRNLHGVTSVTNRFGSVTDFGYEVHGQHTTTTVETWEMKHILSGTGSLVYSEPTKVPYGQNPDISSAGILRERKDPEGRSYGYQRDTVLGTFTLGTTLPGGAQINRNFHLDGRPSSVTGNGTNEMVWQYTWGVGGVPQKVETQYVADPDEKTIREYDFLGRLVKETSPDPDGTGVITSTHVYNTVTGLKEKVVRDFGVNTLYTYDNLNRIHRIVQDVNDNDQVDLNGTDRIQEWEYKTFFYQLEGPANQTTEYIYPEEGQGRKPYRQQIQLLSGLKTITKALDQLETISTTEVTKGNPAVFTTTTVYPDGMTEVVKTKQGLVRSREATTAGGDVLSSLTYSYDEDGPGQDETGKLFLEEVHDLGRGTTLYTHYKDGRVHTRTTPPPEAGKDPLVTTFEYSGVGTIGYPNNGTRTVTTLPDNSSKITETYSPRGELLKREGELKYPVAFTYDHAGRRETMTTWKDHDALTGAATTTWVYNDAGLLRQKIFPVASNTCLYTYHSNGVMHTETLASGAVKTYTTDALGQNLGVSYSDSTPSVTNTYDRFGRIETVTDAVGMRTYQYDQNTLQVETITYTNGILDGHVLTYNQDSLHRPWSVLLEQDDVLKHRNVYEYKTGSSLLDKIIGNDKEHQHHYAANRGSELKKITHAPLGQSGSATVQTDYAYDKIGRLMSLGHKDGATILSSNAYEYNLLSQREKNTLSDGTHWSYQYDNEGQLTSAIKYTANSNAIPGYAYTYDYDDIGNRKKRTKNAKDTTYTPNSLNQYASITRPAYNHLVGDVQAATTTVEIEVVGEGTHQANHFGLSWDKNVPVTKPVSTYILTATDNGNVNSSPPGSMYTPSGVETPEYDDDGNQTKDTYWVYTWDAENRLIRQEHRDDEDAVSIVPLVRTRIEYTYDSQSRRIRRVIRKWDAVADQFMPYSDTLFVYDGWNLLAEFDKASPVPHDLIRTYTWGKDLSGTLQGAGGVGGLLNAKDHRTAPAKTVFAFADGIGNIQQYYDPEATTDKLIAEYEYAPFGNIIKSVGPDTKRFPHRFASKYECPESGHLYFGYRSLNPETGSWLSRDPLGEEGGLNLYGYANNDPINGFDVLGLFVDIDAVLARAPENILEKGLGEHGVIYHELLVQLSIEYSHELGGLLFTGPSDFKKGLGIGNTKQMMAARQKILLEARQFEARAAMDRWLASEATGYFANKYNADAAKADIIAGWLRGLASQYHEIAMGVHEGKYTGNTADNISVPPADAVRHYRDVLDGFGVVDQTGISDLASAGLSVLVGDNGTAVISVGAAIPFADLVKLHHARKLGILRKIDAPNPGAAIPESTLVKRIMGRMDLYPKVTDLRTGRAIPFPSGVKARVPKANRVEWGSVQRGEFIAEWHRRGYPRPKGGWDKYDIHHIQPREFGGDNSFWNLAPVERGTHQSLFNSFWREFTEL